MTGRATKAPPHSWPRCPLPYPTSDPTLRTISRAAPCRRPHDLIKCNYHQLLVLGGGLLLEGNIHFCSLLYFCSLVTPHQEISAAMTSAAAGTCRINEWEDGWTLTSRCSQSAPFNVATAARLQARSGCTLAAPRHFLHLVLKCVSS